MKARLSQQATDLDNPTNVTRDDIDFVVTTLMNNDAFTISDNLEAENKFGSSPIRDAFFGLCSTKISADLENVERFIHKAEYPDTSKALRSEWGSAGSVRFLLSSIGSETENASDLGADVFDIFICGMESYAIIDQDGYSSQFIYRPPIYSGALAPNATIGYKMAQVPRILNESWIANLRCTLYA